MLWNNSKINIINRTGMFAIYSAQCIIYLDYRPFNYKVFIGSWRVIKIFFLGFRQAFDISDRDQVGRISLPGLRNAVQWLGYQPPERWFHDTMQGADPDGRCLIRWKFTVENKTNLTVYKTVSINLQINSHWIFRSEDVLDQEYASYKPNMKEYRKN